MKLSLLTAALLLLTGCVVTGDDEQCIEGEFISVTSQLHKAEIDRLRKPPFSNKEREKRVYQYFENNCPDLRKEPIDKSPGNNVICRITGKQAPRIIVAAHYDQIGAGYGVADNWSGIVLVSQLIEALSQFEPESTWEIIAFGEEETGILGSKSYVREHGTEQIRAMINVDTLGLGSVRVDSRSDDRLKCLAKNIATRVEIDLSAALLPQTTGDWEPFKHSGVSVLNLHSLDRRQIRKLHTRKDSYGAISERRMQQAWLLLINLSLYLDQESGR